MASIWPQRISAGYCLYRHHDRRCGGKGIKDLLRKDFRSEIVRFRARRRKNYEAYTAYMLSNFCKAVGQTRGVPVLAGRPVSEIWKLQQNNLYAVGLKDKNRTTSKTSPMVWGGF